MTIKRVFPVLETVSLHNFSLYQRNRKVMVRINDGTFCLAGANGLGKSTFLAAVNFALTGIVADPNRNFTSMREYYRYSLDYGSKYFNGRIEEEDRSSATVSVTFRVEKHRYSVTRNFFEPRALRTFDIINTGNSEPIVYTDGLEYDRLNELYMKRIVEDCHLTSFEQFVFLQHFVNTFDERRHLLFWDETVVVPALYLAFGLDATDADNADALRRKAEKADSLRRNAQWRATAARRRLKSIGGANDVDIDAVRRRYEELTTVAREAREKFLEMQLERDDADLQVAELSSRQANLRHIYDEAFGKRIHAHHNARMHPAIKDLLQGGSCAICGADGEAARNHIVELLNVSKCPLCATLHTADRRTTNMEELEGLDAQLSETQKALSQAQQKATRTKLEVEAAAKAAELAASALAGFESDNTDTLPELLSPTVTLAGQRAAIQAEIDDALHQRDRERENRDRAREQLKPYQARLSAAYESAEQEFVPLFRRLAKSFIGLDLDIFLVPRKPIGFALLLEVQGSRRNTTMQLSESQRFFLDIALRMALMQHMTNTKGGAMLIDTPEGSLDISYEKRAGAMFASFVRDGFQIIMTANINASQLLVELAEQCGSSSMKLVRMTDWTPLTEVQAEAEDLFDIAYQAIEDRLA